MSRISDYFGELKEKYGDMVALKKSNYDEKFLSQVPEALREFYDEYSEAELPFGSIYTIDNSIIDSEAEPFQSEGWFAFGGFSLQFC